MNIKDVEQNNLAEKLYSELEAEGYEVLLDDRKERPGVKFKDRDLIGIPLRVNIGKRAGENIIEFSTRSEKENIEMNIDELKTKIATYIK